MKVAKAVLACHFACWMSLPLLLCKIALPATGGLEEEEHLGGMTEISWASPKLVEDGLLTGERHEMGGPSVPDVLLCLIIQCVVGQFFASPGEGRAAERAGPEEWLPSQAFWSTIYSWGGGISVSCTFPWGGSLRDFHAFSASADTNA